MQPVWLCILSGRPFEDTFENPQRRKVKQMQPVWLCILSGRRSKDTCENTQWRKVEQMQITDQMACLRRCIITPAAFITKSIIHFKESKSSIYFEWTRSKSSLPQKIGVPQSQSHFYKHGELFCRVWSLLPKTIERGVPVPVRCRSKKWKFFQMIELTRNRKKSKTIW